MISTLVGVTVPPPFLPYVINSTPTPVIPAAFDPRPPEIVTGPNSVIYEESPPAFVTRSGTTILLEGQPFRFTGLNMFNANNLDTATCWYPWGQGDALDQSLTAIGSGQTVFRVWFFQAMATRNGARDWSGFDHTLAVAQAHGQRVMVALGNEWSDCEGPGAGIKTESWYRAGYRQPAPGLLSSYRDWVAEVVARYRDRGTILAWQLMNEPSAPTAEGACKSTARATFHSFAADMSTLVKRIDPAHLLSLGTLGWEDCGVGGSDYQAINAIPAVDLCEFHDYSPASPASPPKLMDLLKQRIAQCRALNKPLVIAEAGITVKDAGSRELRAQIFRARFKAWFQAGVAGVLIWDWHEPDEAPGPGWQLGPDDPALAVLGGV